MSAEVINSEELLDPSVSAEESEEVEEAVLEDPDVEIEETDTSFSSSFQHDDIH